MHAGREMIDGLDPNISPKQSRFPAYLHGAIKLVCVDHEGVMMGILAGIVRVYVMGNLRQDKIIDPALHERIAIVRHKCRQPRSSE